MKRPVRFEREWMVHLKGAGCALLLGVLFTSLAVAQDSRRPEERWPEAFGEHWLKVTVLGRRVGWMRTELRVLPDGRYRETNVAEMSVMGAELHMTQVALFDAEPPHRLRSRHSIDRSGGGTEQTTLERDGDAWRLTRVAGGETYVKQGIVTNEVLNVGWLLAGADSMRELAPGHLWTQVSLDGETGRDDVDEYTYVGPTTLRQGGKSVEVGRVRIKEGGTTATLFMDAAGVQRRVVVDRLVTMSRVSKEEALAGGYPPLDLLRLTRVELPGVNEEAPEIDSLVLYLRGIDQLLPETADQRVRWLKEGELQQVHRASAPAPDAAEQAAAIPEAIRPFLEPEPIHPSDHPRIVELARTLTRGAEGSWERTRAICAWVDHNVEDSLEAEQSSALAVLQSKKGDCTEHAALAVALLRAAGVPARRAVGWLVARGEEDEEGYGLYGHAWVQVWVGRWIPVDPTWGLVPATGGYLCGATGEDLGPLGVGMKAEVVKVKYHHQAEVAPGDDELARSRRFIDLHLGTHHWAYKTDGVFETGADFVATLGADGAEIAWKKVMDSLVVGAGVLRREGTTRYRADWPHGLTHHRATLRGDGVEEWWEVDARGRRARLSGSRSSGDGLEGGPVPPATLSFSAIPAVLGGGVLRPGASWLQAFWEDWLGVTVYRRTDFLGWVDLIADGSLQRRGLGRESWLDWPHSHLTWSEDGVIQASGDERVFGRRVPASRVGATPPVFPRAGRLPSLEGVDRERLGRAKRLTLELRGLLARPEEKGARQKVEVVAAPAGGASTPTITVSMAEVPAPRTAGQEVPEDLRAFAVLEGTCDEAAALWAREIAREACGEELDPWKKVVALTTRVFENGPSLLESRTMRISFGTEALHVPETLVALCRAAGVPARVARGLVIVRVASPRGGDERCILRPHTWVEVWVGEWIPVDAAVNEAPVSADHVRFPDGRQPDLSRLEGARVLEMN